MKTHELIVKHNSDDVEIDLGDNEILHLPYPTLMITLGNNETKVITMPPDALKALEGEIIGKSFTDLTLNRVAIVDWTVYSDDWDNEQWTVLSWVIAQKGSTDEVRHVETNIVLTENIRRILEEKLVIEDTYFLNKILKRKGIK